MNPEIKTNPKKNERSYQTKINKMHFHFVDNFVCVLPNLITFVGILKENNMG